MTNKFLTGQFLTRWFGQIKFDWTCNEAIEKTFVLFIFADRIRCSSSMTVFDPFKIHPVALYHLVTVVWTEVMLAVNQRN